MKAHRGQRDAQGRDYVEAHLAPIAAGCSVFGAEAEASGWLHDIVEDTGVSVEDLRQAGIPNTVVQAIVSVTKVEGEAYESLIERACADPLGRYVKFIDNAWNIASSRGLAAIDPERAERMLERKYLPARHRLLAACPLAHEDRIAARIEQLLTHHELLLAHGSRRSPPMRKDHRERP